MINHIDDFANNNIGNFMLNNFNGNYNGNPIQLFENFNIQPNDAFWEPVIPMLVLTTEANNSTINNALNRKTETIKESKNKEEAIEKFFQKSETHTSDSQNVHDSSVIDNLTVTLGKVKSLNKDNIIKENNQEVHICNEISTYINSMQAEDQFKSNALKTLSEMSSNRPVAHYNDTELSILSLIWERSKDPLNEKNSKNMKDAIVTSLAECTTMTNGSVNTVCITGRVNNVLSSIATLDVDQTIGVAYTQEQYRNEILEKCSNITKSAIENAKKSLNPQMKLLGESYSDPNIIVDIETEVQFKNQLKKEFQVVFDNYSKVLRPHTLNKIKEECLMGIE
jgi:hypothetical protein